MDFQQALSRLSLVDTNQDLKVRLQQITADSAQSKEWTISLFFLSAAWPLRVWAPRDWLSACFCWPIAAVRWWVPLPPVTSILCLWKHCCKLLPGTKGVPGAQRPAAERKTHLITNLQGQSTVLAPVRRTAPRTSSRFLNHHPGLLVSVAERGEFWRT